MTNTDCTKDERIKELMKDNGRLVATNRALSKLLEEINDQMLIMMGKLEEIEQNIKGPDNG